MRAISWVAVAALFIAPVALATQQNSQESSSAQSSQASKSSQASSAASQQDPLAAAARKAREERKTAPKAAKVFDNDNLPTAGGISTVGGAPAPAKAEKGQAAEEAAAPGAKTADEWRAKFAELRKKLEQDQNELSVMQRELGQQAMQYYGGDPQKAVQDQQSGHPLGEAYEKNRAAIDAKKTQIEADQQAISDAEDALRRAGGDPGWAR
jgi:chromosome segregation ATPase